MDSETMSNLIGTMIILGADVVAVLLDQIVIKKIAGFALGIPYYIYLVVVNIIFLFLLYAF